MKSQNVNKKNKKTARKSHFTLADALFSLEFNCLCGP